MYSAFAKKDYTQQKSRCNVADGTPSVEIGGRSGDSVTETSLAKVPGRSPWD